jgi:hypothetical protein
MHAYAPQMAIPYEPYPGYYQNAQHFLPYTYDPYNPYALADPQYTLAPTLIVRAKRDRIENSHGHAAPAQVIHGCVVKNSLVYPFFLSF